MVQNPRRPIEAGEGGARGGEGVEKSLFQANQPWAELGEQGRKRKGVARLGDHGGINGKGLMVRPIFPPYQNGLQWHYYHKQFSFSGTVFLSEQLHNH